MEWKILQLPLIKDRCPICRRTVETGKETRINLYSKGGKARERVCKVLSCPTCGLLFSNESLRMEIQKEKALDLRVFPVKGTESIGEIQRRMYLGLNERNQTVDARRGAISDGIWKIHKKIMSAPEDLQSCPTCGSILHDDYTIIPIDGYGEIKVNGRFCGKCRLLYVPDTKTIKLLLKDNMLSKDYTFNGRPMWNYTAEAMRRREFQRKCRIEAERDEQSRNILSNFKSAVVVVVIQLENGHNEEKYVIVNDAQEADGKTVLHYKSTGARELLSGAFAQSRQSRGTLHGKSYKVIRTYTNNKTGNAVPEEITPRCLYLKRRGGYYSSLMNRQSEIVDVLLFAMISGRYEIIRATYDKVRNQYYTDASYYRDFIYTYGKPDVQLKFENRKSSFEIASEWNEESILKEYGYSVSQQDGLTLGERRELLGEIVDLEILPVERVVSLLDFFIRMHPRDEYTAARYKWENDKKFIQNYRVNPLRFIISSNSI